MTGRRYLAALGIAAVVLIGCTAVGMWGVMAVTRHDVVFDAMYAAAVPFAAIAWITIRHDRGQDAATLRRATWLILGAALLMRLMLLPWPPVSTDIYRYVWDGRVTAAGINPFRYVPADPALAFLRDAAVYPNINRATYAPTIYPPVAQIVFRLVALVAGGVTTMKAAMVGFEGVLVAALTALLAGRGLPPTRILIWVWHPLPLYEFAGSGHVDVIAIAFMMLACVAADRGRQAGAGALLAAATLAKFFPLVIAPALWRRWDWRAPMTWIVVAVALYLPFLSVGHRVFGFLFDYFKEEDLVGGDGFYLIQLIDQQVDVPRWTTPAYAGAGLAILAAGALWAVLRRDRAHASMTAAAFLMVAFTIIASPHLAWYFTWALPFLCFRPLWAFLYASCAAPLLYYQADAPDNLLYSTLIYLPFFVIVAVELALGRIRRTPEYHSHVHAG